MSELNKNLKISPELHKKIKIYCAKNEVKINEWVEEQLEKLINEYEMDKRKV
jgi:predicted HicB family RNase H-like nuclease